MLNEFILKIKRQENAFYRELYKSGKRLKSLSIPAPRFVYSPLRTLHNSATGVVDYLARVLYYQPAFMALFESCGKNFDLYGQRNSRQVRPGSLTGEKRGEQIAKATNTYRDRGVCLV